MRRVPNPAWLGVENEQRAVPIGKKGRVPTCFLTRPMMWLLSIIVVAPIWLVDEGPGRADPALRLAQGDPNTQIIAFAFSPDGTTIATSQRDRRVTLRDVADGWSIKSDLGQRGNFGGLAFSHDGRYLALGGTEPDITLLDLWCPGTERRLGIPICRVRALAFSPDGRTLAATSFRHNDIVLWNMDAGRPLGNLRGHGSPVLSIALRRRPVFGFGCEG